MKKPKISVIMSVYNGEKYITECIRSILSQTLTDFEFIIVDDASNDNTPRILQNFSQQDHRIIILTNETNKERIFSRNRAILFASADLIAIMDADDWSYPTRLEKQYSFMLSHPEVDVCGGKVKYYENNKINFTLQSNEEIRLGLLFNSVIAHPTAVYKKELIQQFGGYNTESMTEDYDLWVRFAKDKKIVFKNLPDLLIKYRIHPTVEREEYNKKQLYAANIVRKKMLENTLGAVSPQKLKWHLACCRAEYSPICALFFSFFWLMFLKKQLKDLGYSPNIINKVLLVFAKDIPMDILRGIPPIRKFFRIIKRTLKK